MLNIQQLHDANQEITKLEAQLASQQKEHDAEIANIEDVNNAISKLNDLRVNRLVDENKKLNIEIAHLNRRCVR